MNKKVLPIIGICVSSAIMIGVLVFVVMFVKCFFWLLQNYSFYEEDFVIYGGMFFLVITAFIIWVVIIAGFITLLSILMSKTNK